MLHVLPADCADCSNKIFVTNCYGGEPLCIKETDEIPSLILISNGDVMSKRMRPKVLKVPEYEEESFDYKYTQVLLYGDVHSLDELTEDHVNRAFEEVNNAGESTLKSRRR